MNVIITGATGMVGEGVLYEALHSEYIDKILVIGRRSCGIKNSKLSEIIVPDFFNLSAVTDKLKDYDACFFCLGTSSVGMKVEEYYKLTYNLTMNFARTFSSANSDAVFCYVSGAGTDTSEKGKLAWARIKGKTENDLIKLPFRNVYNFRPGFMKPTKGLKNTLSYYKYLSWSYPFGKIFAPSFFIKLSQLGKAMINAAVNGFDKNIITARDIINISEKNKF